MIQFRNITKSYRGIPVIKDFTCSVEKGEFAFICGPTGSGKSTLLKLLMCIEKCDSGSVMFMDEDLTTVKESRIPFIRRSIGFIFQDGRLLSNKNVFENIALVLKVCGHNKKEIDYRVSEALRLVGMSDKIYSYPYSLSGGELQKVAAARAIVNDPVLLLADEPAGSLDADSSLEIYNIFNKINSTGTTVIVATHNLGTAEKTGKRIIRLTQ
ncbi:MAG: ATP-binding cassette domain-containing protein [Nitrospirae bacterium]|nr:ATP-binding cassette domain-containing protein [Nitrospirota bacterium]